MELRIRQMSLGAPDLPPDFSLDSPLGSRAIAPGEVQTVQPTQTFEQFFSDSYPSMLRFAVALLPSRQTAEDILQDAYLKLYARFASLENPEAYLRRAIVNLSTSFFRRRHLAAAKESLVQKTPFQPEHDTMLSVLDKLPARQRSAIVLRFYEQCTEAEIAEVLDCRPGTVKSLLSRGIAAIREVLKHA
jgi:RNA polymerase sigma-70 factor (sigma-E family)